MGIPTHLYGMDIKCTVHVEIRIVSYLGFSMNKGETNYENRRTCPGQSSPVVRTRETSVTESGQLYHVTTSSFASQPISEGKTWIPTN